MKRTRALTLGAGLALLTTAVIVGMSAARLNANIRASGGFETPIGFFGIAEGQTARLSAGNIRASGGFERDFDGIEVQSGGFEKPAACFAQLNFLDMDGSVVASRSVRLAAGKGAFLDFALPPSPVSETSDTAMMRAQLRATVRYRSEDPSVPCQVQTTLEVINNMTARTMVFAQALASSGLPTGSSRIDIEPEQ